MGYDGYREDALENIFGMEQSAVKRIAKEGGLFHSYAGANGNQDTSTAPGWLSILSGKWAYQLGVQDNTGRKDAGTATFLNDAVSAGYPSTFIASWAPHFDVTYQEDIMNAEGKAVYQQMDSDAETLETLQKRCRIHPILPMTSSLRLWSIVIMQDIPLVMEMMWMNM